MTVVRELGDEVMGLAKSSQILSAFELARRHLVDKAVRIQCAADILPWLADISTKSQEHFVCITLNGANAIDRNRKSGFGAGLSGAKFGGVLRDAHTKAGLKLS